MNKIYYCNSVKVVYLVRTGNYQLEPLNNNKVIVGKTNTVIEEPWYYYQSLLDLDERYLSIMYPKNQKGDTVIYRIDPIEIYLPNYSCKHKKLFISHESLIHVRNFIGSRYYDQEEIDKRVFSYFGLSLDDNIFRIQFNLNSSDNSEKLGEIIPFSRKL